MAKAKRIMATNFGKVISLLLAGIILLTMFAGCTEAKEKTPEEEFSMAKEEVRLISTQNFYTFKEFIQNVVLKEAEIDVDDLFIKIDNDNTITVHVLSNQEYRIYTIESRQNWGIVNAITSEGKYIYLASHDDDGKEIYLQRPFNESIWNSWWYDVKGEHIFMEP